MTCTIPDELKSVLIDTLELSAHNLLRLAKERRDWLAGRCVICRWDVETLLARKQEILDGDKLKVRMAVTFMSRL